jgi:PAS domain S-box-containing protein
VLLIDKKQIILVAEGGGLHMTGKTRTDLVGRSLPEVLPDEVLKELQPLHKAALMDIPAEKDIPYQEGLLHVQVVPVREGHAPVHAALVIATDVTKQRERERMLQESEACLKSVFDHALVGIYRTTPEGRILMANPALVSMLGFASFEELSRRNLSVDGFETSTPRSFFLEEIEKKGYALGVETTWKRADGRPIYVRDSASAIRDQKGATIYYEGTVEDITERKLMEDRMRREKEFASSIIEAARSLVVGLDEQGRVVLFNKECEAVTGWDRQDAQGKVWFENFVSERTRPMTELAFDRMRQGISSQWMDSLVTMDEEKTIIWQNTMVKRDEGEIVVSIGVDITDKERYKAQIEQLNQSLRIVNSILRHDIQNDLTVAGGSLELYRSKGDERLLDMTQSSMKKISYLISKMKELESIISTNELKMLSARNLVKEVVSHYSSFPVEFEVEGDCMIFADEALVPALDNIINNAIVHGRTERIKVVIRKDPEQRSCEMRIADYGKGVPPEIKGMIFQEGFRYGEMGNTGLGLYIVKKTMERYGGQVSVEDNQPKGAVFVLRFKSGGPSSQTR